MENFHLDQRRTKIQKREESGFLIGSMSGMESRPFWVTFDFHNNFFSEWLKLKKVIFRLSRVDLQSVRHVYQLLAFFGFWPILTIFTTFNHRGT